MRAVGIITLLSSCLFQATAPPDREPEVTGVITRVESLDGGLRLLIEEDSTVSDFSSPKGIFWMDGTEILVRRVDGSWRHGGLDDLDVGLSATGWYKNDVLVFDTFPREGEASHIAINDPLPND
jgi:hypothetical protein